MKALTTSAIFQQSLPYKLHYQCSLTIKTILKHSCFIKGFKHVWAFIELIVHHSSFIGYFQQNQCFLDSFFQHSLILDSFSKFFFKLTNLTTFTIHEAFKNTFFHRHSLEISREISLFSLRPFAFLFFAYLSIYASMRMIFGQGFNRNEILIIFSILVFLWFLSHIRIPLSFFSKKSYFLAFLKELIS